MSRSQHYCSVCGKNLDQAGCCGSCSQLLDESIALAADKKHTSSIAWRSDSKEQILSNLRSLREDPHVLAALMARCVEKKEDGFFTLSRLSQQRPFFNDFFNHFFQKTSPKTSVTTICLSEAYQQGDSTLFAMAAAMEIRDSAYSTANGFFGLFRALENAMKTYKEKDTVIFIVINQLISSLFRAGFYEESINTFRKYYGNVLYFLNDQNQYDFHGLNKETAFIAAVFALIQSPLPPVFIVGQHGAGVVYEGVKNAFALFELQWKVDVANAGKITAIGDEHFEKIRQKKCDAIADVASRGYTEIFTQEDRCFREILFHVASARCAEQSNSLLRIYFSDAESYYNEAVIHHNSVVDAFRNNLARQLNERVFLFDQWINQRLRCQKLFENNLLSRKKKFRSEFAVMSLFFAEESDRLNIEAEFDRQRSITEQTLKNDLASFRWIERKSKDFPLILEQADIQISEIKKLMMVLFPVVLEELFQRVQCLKESREEFKKMFDQFMLEFLKFIEDNSKEKEFERVLKKIDDFAITIFIAFELLSLIDIIVSSSLVGSNRTWFNVLSPAVDSKKHCYIAWCDQINVFLYFASMILRSFFAFVFGSRATFFKEKCYHGILGSLFKLISSSRAGWFVCLSHSVLYGQFFSYSHENLKGLVSEPIQAKAREYFLADLLFAVLNIPLITLILNYVSVAIRKNYLEKLSMVNIPHSFFRKKNPIASLQDQSDFLGQLPGRSK